MGAVLICLFAVNMNLAKKSDDQRMVCVCVCMYVCVCVHVFCNGG